MISWAIFRDLDVRCLRQHDERQRSQSVKETIMTNAAQVFMPAGNRMLRKMFLAVAVVCTLTSVGLQPAHAQTFSVLHYFMGATDGATVFAGLSVAPSGVLYGTATKGGLYGVGTVFKLQQVNSSWVFSPLYEFTGGSDAATHRAG